MKLQRLVDKDIWLEERGITPGVTEIRVSNRMSRLLGFWSSLYLAGDILIDTGFPHASGLIDRYLAKKTISAIVCTHNHEDHAGNCGILSLRHNCPVYLANSHLQWEEGVRSMPFYRKLWWGTVSPYLAEELPAQVVNPGRSLRRIPTPGHSQTQVSFFDEESGALFSGDLYISSGASAIMRHENPFQTIQSLRKVAELAPDILLSGHSLILEKPASRLLEKAERMEATAEKIIEFRSSGMTETEIVNHLFRYGRTRNRLLSWFSAGEFSRVNFVQACMRHNPKA